MLSIFDFLFSFLIFYLGACVFSFVNVVVYRLPKKMDYIKGHSVCPSCGKRLKWYHNLPVFGFVLLRGKCGFCGDKISPRYLIFELLGGVLSLFTQIYYINLFNFEYTSVLRYLVVFAFLAVLTAVFFTDLDTMEIPNGFSIFIAVLAVASFFLFPNIGILERGIGALAVSLPMLLISLCVKGAFGGGDIKLMGAVGLFLGWKLNLFAFFVSILLGGIYAAALLIIKKKDKKAQIPFGPFLAVGTAFSWFFGSQIIYWYLGLFGF